MKLPFGFKIIRNEARGVHTNKGQGLQALLSSQGVRVAPKDLWQIYRMNADVYSCIREWRQGVGDGGHRYFDPRDKETDPNPRVRDYVEMIFDNSGGRDKIKGQALRDIGISGNAFFEIVEGAGAKIHSLNRLDPRTMYVVADAHGHILRYVQRVAGHPDVAFSTDRVWHIKIDGDPDNELLGFSPLETATWEARTDIAAAQSNYYFFENDAVPSHLYILDSDLSEEEQKAAMEGIRDQFSGAENRHKSSAIAGVKEVKTISLSQKDMEFVLGRKFNTDKVCSVYGVPKFILGYTETVNYSSGTKLLSKFYAGTIRPLEQAMEAAERELYKMIGIDKEIRLEYLPQKFGEELETTKIALDEYRSGALTLRQYKVKTGQAITEEDEKEPNIDVHIIHAGAGARLLEDVSVDPYDDLYGE